MPTPVPRPGIVCTASGKPFDVCFPTWEMIEPRDIAQGLANTCRFGGHTKEYYSVAHHSLAVMFELRRGGASYTIQLGGLCHDGSEFVLGDMPAPIKALLPEYQTLERGVQQEIYRTFGLPREWASAMPEEIKKADITCYHREREHLMPHVDWWAHKEGTNKEFLYSHLTRDAARQAWLDCFYNLQARRGAE